MARTKQTSKRNVPPTPTAFPPPASHQTARKSAPTLPDLPARKQQAAKKVARKSQPSWNPPAAGQFGGKREHAPRISVGVKTSLRGKVTKPPKAHRWRPGENFDAEGGGGSRAWNTGFSCLWL